jgi:hypothetical protein
VTTPLKSNKKAVELAPGSRIRREPVRADNKLESLASRIDWGSREWEIRFAVAGIIFFALALSAVVIDIGHLVDL